MMAGIPLGDGGPRGLPLSTAYRAGDFICAAGQVGFGADGKLVAGGIEADPGRRHEQATAANAETVAQAIRFSTASSALS